MPPVFTFPLPYNLDSKSFPMTGHALGCNVRLLLAVLVLAGSAATPSHAEPVAVALPAYRPASGVVVAPDGPRLRLTWPMTEREVGILVLHPEPTQPLIEALGIATTASGPMTPLLRGVNPLTLLTV